MSEAIRDINIALQALTILIEIIIILQLKTGADRADILNRKCARMLMTSVFCILSSIMYLIFQGGDTIFAFFAVRAGLIFEYCSSYLLAVMFLDYIVSLIGTRTNISRKPVYAAYIAAGIVIFLTVVSPLNPMFVFFVDNEYQRGNFFWFIYVMPTALMLAIICIIFRYKNYLRFHERLCFALYAIVAIIAVGVVYLFYGVVQLNITIALVIIAIYVNIQSEQARLLKERELELTNARISVMLSQIQPHFIYNTLTTIENLCRKDSEMAAKLTRDFSDYLRVNMDSLTQKELVSFNREMEFIKVYLDIEKTRFNERLKIVYDLEVSDFMLPILSVQPLVENAVRHGVTKKISGGTVFISSRRVPQGIKIVVSDDGVGFDLDNADAGIAHNERSHVGIQNVHERLKIQCGGTLTVESEKGKGTVCTIIIPKGV